MSTPAPNKSDQLLSLLDQLETILHEQGIWPHEAPDDTAMASVQPFAVDTMSFEQWLVYVFVPKLRALAMSGAVLPTQCNVGDMAEEVLQSCIEPQKVYQSIRRIDRLLSA